MVQWYNLKEKNLTTGLMNHSGTGDMATKEIRLWYCIQLDCSWYEFGMSKDDLKIA